MLNKQATHILFSKRRGGGGMSVLLASLVVLVVPLTAQAEMTYCKEGLTIPELMALEDGNGNKIYHLIDLTNSTNIVGVIYGTIDKDLILGPPDGALITSLSGDDCIIGGAGDDQISGDDGDDYVYGGDGDDTLHGGNGNDYIVGGPGTDVIDGQRGDDITYQDGEPVTNPEPTYCVENLTISQLIDSGNYTVIDKRADNTIMDQILGTSNNDLILLSDQDNTASALEGDDCVIGGAKFNNIIGGPGNDHIYGNEGNDFLHGGPGDDHIHGGPGIVDWIYGNEGNDTIYGGPGDDSIWGEDGNDNLSGDEGNDSIYGGPGDDNIYGNKGLDYVQGGAGYNTVYQDDGPNAGGSPLKTPQSSNNTILGTQEGPLIETADAGNAADATTYCAEDLTIQELVTSNIYNVIDERNSSKSKITGTNADDLILVHDQGANVKGKKGNDCIIGGVGPDDLRGNKGDDYIHGDKNDRRIAGGQGNDTCTDTPNTKDNCETLS